jgi:hypothetical protein
MATVGMHAVDARDLAHAADEYFELRGAATRVVAVWGDLLLQLGELKHVTSADRWGAFATNIIRLRESMVELHRMVMR